MKKGKKKNKKKNKIFDVGDLEVIEEILDEKEPVLNKISTKEDDFCNLEDTEVYEEEQKQVKTSENKIYNLKMTDVYEEDLDINTQKEITQDVIYNLKDTEVYEEEIPKLKKKKKRKKIVIVLYILLLIIEFTILGILLYNYFSNNNDKTSIIDESDEIVFDDSEYDLEYGETTIGYLTIESIDLIEAPIAEGTDETTVLNNYIGHFEESAYLEGNVCLAAHNNGYDHNYFANLKDVSFGDTIIYYTKYETKTYTVTDISEIKETDVSVIENTAENKITLITCISGKPKYRLCVVGEEIEDTQEEETTDETQTQDEENV